MAQRAAQRRFPVPARHLPADRDAMAPVGIVRFQDEPVLMTQEMLHQIDLLPAVSRAALAHRARPGDVPPADGPLLLTEVAVVSLVAEQGKGHFLVKELGTERIDYTDAVILVSLHQRLGRPGLTEQ